MTYDPQNIFSQILRKDIPADILYEDDFCLSFHDKFPQAPIHVLVIPKGPYNNFSIFHQMASHEEIIQFYQGIQKTIDLLKLDDGFRLVSNTGAIGGLTVDHYHVHILAGQKMSHSFLHN